MSDYTLNIFVQGQDGASAPLHDVAQQLKGVGEAADSTSGQTGGFFSNLLSTAGGFLAANVIGSISGQITGFISGGISDARDAAIVFAQTEAVIKSTGGTAGLTAEQIADMAASMSAAAGKSLFGDDDIQKGQNVLLTFTEIGKEVFPLATQASLDMAQALHKTPEAMSMMLGKALNSAEGFSALKKSGVAFTESQEEQIKTLFATGHAAEAQKIILAELNKEFGGSAQAAANADGGMAQFKDQLGELGEQLGGLALPLLNRLVSALTTHVMPVMQRAADAVGTLGKYFSAVAEDGDYLNDFLGDLPAGIRPVVQFIGNLVSSLQIADEWSSNWGDTLGWVADQFLGFGDSFSPVRAALTNFATSSGALIDGVVGRIAAAFSDGGLKGGIASFIAILAEVSPGFALMKAAVDAALPPIQAIVVAVFGIISGFLHEHGAKIVADLTGAWQQIQGLITALTPPIQAIIASVFGAIATFLEAHGAEIQAFLGQTWDAIAQIVKTAIELIQAIIVPVLTYVAKFIGAHGKEIQALLTNSWNSIKALIDAALTLIQGVITVALDIIHGNWAKAWEDIKAMSARIVTDLITVIKSGLDNLQVIFGGAIDAIKHAWDGLVASASGIGANIMQGILSGLQSKWEEVVAWLNDKLAAAQAIWNSITGGGDSGSGGGGDPEHRASGGPVGAGQTYLVGEQGPELFVPRSSGAILSTPSLAGLLGQAGPTNQTVITIAPGAIVIQQLPGQNVEQLAELVMKKITQKIALRG